MGMEVNKLSTADMNTSYRRLSNADAVQLSAIHLEHGHEDGTDANSGSTGELSGIYFGILNSKLPSGRHPPPPTCPCCTPRCLYYFGGGQLC